MAARLQEDISIKMPKFLIPFAISNIPDAAGVAGFEYRMHRDGSVIGLSVRHNADLTDGVITWRILKNGSAVSTYTVATNDTTQGASLPIAADAVPFVAGDVLSIDWTKSGTVAPTTTDVGAYLEVMFYNDEV